VEVGRKAFLDAWSLVLHGHEEKVPPFHAAETDPLATLGTQPTEPYKYAEKQLRTWQMLIFGLRYVVDKLWSPSQNEEGRIIVLPASYIQHLRGEALLGLQQCMGEKSNVSFISEGDAICAWWIRHLVRAQIPTDSKRTIVVNNALGLRSRLGSDLLPPESAYISNAFCLVPVFMTVKDVLTKPLGFLAAAIRQSYLDLGTKPQIEAVASINRTAQDKGSAALFGDPWMHMVVCSNWSKADIYNADFSGALQKAGRRTGDSKAGRPSFIHVHVFTKGFSKINTLMIAGSDAGKNVWLYGVLRKEVWPLIERTLGDIGPL
jgi:hypothetical protein